MSDSRMKKIFGVVVCSQFVRAVWGCQKIIIIIIIIRKFIMRTCRQALSMNRRRGQSLGG